MRARNDSNATRVPGQQPRLVDHLSQRVPQTSRRGRRVPAAQLKMPVIYRPAPPRRRRAPSARSRRSLTGLGFCLGLGRAGQRREVLNVVQAQTVGIRVIAPHVLLPGPVAILLPRLGRADPGSSRNLLPRGAGPYGVSAIMKLSSEGRAAIT